MTVLLDVQDLGLAIASGGSSQTILREVSFSVEADEAVALVGESGAGKSMTLRAILRLLPPGAVLHGSVVFDGQSLTNMSEKGLRSIRRDRIGMVFQDPRSHINPVRSVGDFLVEALVTNRGLARRAAEAKVVGLLDDVEVSNARARLRQYPHELSGGQLQRVMIASALAIDPDLLLADEPTSSLDVTTQSDVMALLDELRRKHRLALLLVTHDLDLAAAVCGRTGVMYAGSLVEERSSHLLHRAPRHPYTVALGASRPTIERRVSRLTAIPGRPLSASEAPTGCAFAPRCRYAEEQCRANPPRLRHLAGGRVACWRAESLDLSKKEDSGTDAQSRC